MNSDFVEILQFLNVRKVKYLVIGGYAVTYYSEPRYTKDLDILVEDSKANSIKLFKVLKEFGAPVDNLNELDFAEKGTIYVFGIPPNRIDILSGIKGVNFETLCGRRQSTTALAVGE